MSGLGKTLTGCLNIVYYWIESIILFFVPVRLKSKDISGELVLVTGAGSGLGRIMALKFAHRGCNLVLWDINAKGNEGTAVMARKAGAEAYAYSVDVTNADVVYSAAAKVKRDAGVVTIVVNNAGIVTGKPFLDLDEKSIRKVFDVNVLAHFWVMKAFLPDMLEMDHGHLVSISSLAGLTGSPKLTDYCASKSAACTLMEALKVELHSQGRRNIHTTVICPYFINTGLFDGASSRVLKNLEPDFVAEEVINSVLCNKSLVMIPRVFHTLYQLKVLLPARSLLALHDATGGTESMAEFEGRRSSKVQ